ncbi:MAG: META domain-containing protein [Alphaproteobacteria bacterium]
MAIPLFPLIIVALGLTACAKAVTAKPPADRTLYTLEGSEWGLGSSSDQFVQFRSGGEMSGHGGCNNFFGTYDLNGTKLTVGPLASTKKMCRDSMEAESAFISALQQARRIDATHFSLVLFGVNGDTLLTLQRRDWD